MALVAYNEYVYSISTFPVSSSVVFHSPTNLENPKSHDWKLLTSIFQYLFSMRSITLSSEAQPPFWVSDLAT